MTVALYGTGEKNFGFQMDGFSTFSVSNVAGDVKGDKQADCADLAIVSASLLKKRGDPGFDPRADVDYDGDVDKADYLYVLGQIPAAVRKHCPSQ